MYSLRLFARRGSTTVRQVGQSNAHGFLAFRQPFLCCADFASSCDALTDANRSAPLNERPASICNSALKISSGRESSDFHHGSSGELTASELKDLPFYAQWRRGRLPSTNYPPVMCLHLSCRSGCPLDDRKFKILPPALPSIVESSSSSVGSQHSPDINFQLRGDKFVFPELYWQRISDDGLWADSVKRKRKKKMNKHKQRKLRRRGEKKK
eukprot:TRINITY_DN15237_c0_g1_i2.p1 TRINITY_DN15237_c0_g1~~TRINITY_DN15237_c0_g1_i2.p1  ORF type:complete len:211 (-),score=2.97 TRINITY_DN15237_c0_g1_i2:13-645(-)